MKEIYHCFWINAPIQKIYSALTEESGLSGWWTKYLKVGRTVDSISTFRFQSDAFNKMRIMRLDPQRIEWECVDGHEAWIGTKICFELRPEEEATKVCFSHYNWKTQSEYTGECSFHWANYLESLQKYCETGEGMPDKGR